MAYIQSIEYYLPENIVTNQEIIAEWSNDANYEKLLSKIGVEKRHIAAKDELVSDLAIKAAKKLLENNSILPSEIDFLLLCTQSPDFVLPTTSCIIQDRLGIPTNCGAFDFNLGCSGFIYGLAIAESLTSSQIASNVLLLTSETYSKHINSHDKSTRLIFGDGAAATLIKKGNANQAIGKFVLGTDGKGEQNLIIQAGGMKLPKTSETSNIVMDKHGNYRSQDNLYMNGPEIYSFVLNNIPQLVKDTLIKNNLEFDDIDCFIFHQASKYVLDNIRKKLGIPDNKFFVNVSSVGNTVCASIPIALKQADAQGRIKKGDNIMLVGFGVGYSWGGTIIKW